MTSAAIAATWVEVLREHAARSGQAATARLIGYSPTVVNQVLKGKYPGDLCAVEQRVMGALMGATVDCPVVGELPRNKCLDHQKAAFAPTNPERALLWRTCPGCTHRLVTSKE